MAVGSLREKSHVEIHDINTASVTAVLRHHTDMIDSLLKFEFPHKVSRNKNEHVQWLVSAGRDRKVVLWKLIDGKVMTKSDFPPVKTLVKSESKAKSRNQKKRISSTVDK